MRTLKLNSDEVAELMRSTTGQGGWQGLIDSLQSSLDAATGEISLSTQDMQRIPRYAFDYGNGGWEDRLRKIFQRHLGEDLAG